MAASASQPAGGSARPCLLVADDDSVTRELLGAMLRAHGYGVELVSDGRDAVERVAEGGVDLVLLDASMPGMSGLEACQVIKGMSAGAFVPVVIATVKTDPTSRVEGLKTGADDYVCKPFEEGEVLARVAAMLRLKSVYDEMQEARAKLERVSTHDELTGLHNYRYLHNRLADEFARAERLREPLACCLIDVDRLKAHNEWGGRALGDTILRAVADAIRRSVRDTDVTARYGGDEFLVMLPGTHFAGSLTVAQRIWREAAALTWTVQETTVRLGLSIGVALFPSRDVRSRDALLRAADEGLLQAKRDGANRVCVFQQHGVVYSAAVEGPHGGAEDGPRATQTSASFEAANAHPALATPGPKPQPPATSPKPKPPQSFPPKSEEKA